MTPDNPQRLRALIEEMRDLLDGQQQDQPTFILRREELRLLLDAASRSIPAGEDAGLAETLLSIGDEYGAVNATYETAGAAMRDAAARLSSLSSEFEQVRARLEKAELDLRAQECLHVSAYQSGVKAGWNLCVDDDHDGYQAATASTEHVAELKRVRAARRWIEGGDNG